MDEPKIPTQDTPSGKPGLLSGSETGSISEKTFTKAEHQKALSDALSKAGYDAASLGAREKAITAREEGLESQQTEIETLQNRLDDLERQGLGDSPEAEKLLRERQEIRKAQRKLQEEQANLERDKLQHAEDIRVVRESKWDITVWEIASKHGVDPMVLKELGLTSAEQVEKAAKIFADAKVASGQGTETPLGEGATSGLKTDSAKGKGGGKDLSGQPAWKIYSDSFAEKKR